MKRFEARDKDVFLGRDRLVAQLLNLTSAHNLVGLRPSKLAALEAGTADSLAQVVTELRPADELWLLVVDQFEEIFTLCEQAEKRAAFLDGQRDTLFGCGAAPRPR